MVKNLEFKIVSDIEVTYRMYGLKSATYEMLILPVHHVCVGHSELPTSLCLLYGHRLKPHIAVVCGDDDLRSDCIIQILPKDVTVILQPPLPSLAAIVELQVAH